MNVRSRGLNVHYDAVGSPQLPAVLLLHGALGRGRDWFERGFVAPLTEQFRVIAVDILGGGLSDKPHDASAYDERLLVEDFVCVLAAEKAARAAVWGYSWGAHLAFALATYRPDVVTRLVLGGHDPTKGLADFHSTASRRIDVLRRGGFDEYWRAAGWGPDAAEWDGLSYNDPLAHAAMLEGRSFEGDLASLDVPTLLYAGDRDPAWAGVVASAAGSRHQVVAVPGLDHASAADASEVLVPIVRQFLLEGAGAS